MKIKLKYKLTGDIIVPAVGWSTSYFPVNQNIKDICGKQPKQKLKLFGYSINTEKDYYEVSPGIMYDHIIFIKSKCLKSKQCFVSLI